MGRYFAEQAPGGATSFKDLESQEQAEFAAQRARELAGQFETIVANIISNPDVPDKSAAIQAQAAELVKRTSEVKQMVTRSPARPAPQASAPAQEAQHLPPRGQETRLAESDAGAILDLQEAAEAPASGVPLYLNVRLIKPGWGNKRDMNYYPADVLKRDAGVFVGSKMYESDHRPNEKSTRTWVSTIESIAGFASDGAPIGRVAVHDPNFAERLRALSKAGLLHRMECSILGDGTSRRGRAPDGVEGHLVEGITRAAAVDWVTVAGAGGQAMNLAESAAAAATTPARMSEAQYEANVKALFERYGVPYTEPVAVDPYVGLSESERHFAEIDARYGLSRPSPLAEAQAPAPKADPDSWDKIARKYGLGDYGHIGRF